MEKSVTKPFTHVIKFWDNTKKFITEEQNKQIISLMLNNMNGFEINGSIFKFKDIQKHLTIKEYYEMYPQEKPVKYDTSNKDLYRKILKPLNPNKRKKALQYMIEGFKKTFAGRSMLPQSKILLNKMESKLKNL